MNKTLTIEEHAAELKKLLAENELETYHLKMNSDGAKRHAQVELRREKEFLEHELFLLGLKDGSNKDPRVGPVVTSHNPSQGDDTSGPGNKEPVAV